MINYLLTFKLHVTERPHSQSLCDEHEALNLVRSFMVKVFHIEENLADFQAMEFMDSVEPGKAKSISADDDRILIVQVQKKH